MKKRRAAIGFYWTGVALSFLYIAAAELIWLPDPLQWPGGLTWLETIDRLLYAPALVSLCWLAGAWQAWRSGRHARIGRGLAPPARGSLAKRVPAPLLRLAIAAAAGSALVSAVLSPRDLITTVVLLLAAWLLVIIDLFVIELSARDRRRRLPIRSIGGVVVQLLLAAFLLLPIPYNVTYPGLTINMNHYAKVEGGASHSSLKGVLVFDRRAVSFDWLLSKLLPIYELSPVPPDQPPLREAYAEVVAMKSEAETAAAAVAFGKLGIGQGAVAEGVTITAVASEAAARGVLKAGDTIVKVADKVTNTVAALTTVMQAVKPGSAIAVEWVRSGEKMTGKVPTGVAKDEDSGKERAVFGVSVQTAYRYDIPRTVRYERPFAHIGGPSHGAMLALTIIDQLTPGGVANGWRAAGTGTIEPDGTVGPVGGVRQKAYAVARTDAQLFFVPASEAEEARLGAPSLRIVPVNTLDEMLDWLKTHSPGK